MFSGTMGYCRMLLRERTMGRRVNRPREEGEEERRVKKLIGDSTWFHNRSKEELPKLDGGTEQEVEQVPGRGCSIGGGRRPAHKARGRPPPRKPRGVCSGRPCPPKPTVHKPTRKAVRSGQPETVVFVPSTKGSLLKKRLQKADNIFATLHKTSAVRFVEKGGRKVAQIVGTPDPWSGTHCGRPGCAPCSDPTQDNKRAAPRGACNQEGCLYSLECLLCEQRDPKVEAHYYGETGRSANCRGKEHSAGVQKRDPAHPVIKHMLEQHKEQMETGPEWRMRVLRTFKRPLQRQVAEGVIIERSKVGFRLNSKGEWHSARMPRLQVEVGTWVQQSEYRGSEQPWRPIEHVNHKEKEKGKKRTTENDKEPATKRRKKSEEIEVAKETQEEMIGEKEKTTTRNEGVEEKWRLERDQIVTRKETDKAPSSNGKIEQMQQKNNTEVLGDVVEEVKETQEEQVDNMEEKEKSTKKRKGMREEWKFMSTDIRERKEVRKVAKDKHPKAKAKDKPQPGNKARGLAEVTSPLLNLQTRPKPPGNPRELEVDNRKPVDP